MFLRSAHIHMHVNLSKSKMESPRWVTTTPCNKAFTKFRRLYNVHTVPVIFSTIPRFWCSIFWTAKRLNFRTVKIVPVNGTPKRTMQIFFRCRMNYVYYVLSYNLVSLKLVVHFFTSAKPDTSQKKNFLSDPNLLVSVSSIGPPFDVLLHGRELQ